MTRIVGRYSIYGSAEDHARATSAAMAVFDAASVAPMAAWLAFSNWRYCDPVTPAVTAWLNAERAAAKAFCAARWDYSPDDLYLTI